MALTIATFLHPSGPGRSWPWEYYIQPFQKFTALKHQQSRVFTLWHRDMNTVYMLYEFFLTDLAKWPIQYM